jgi:hypothetical protein
MGKEVVESANENRKNLGLDEQVFDIIFSNSCVAV